MRAPGGFAVAVRRPTGEIVVRKRAWNSLAERWPVLKLPILRGIAVLVESITGGFEALSFAADQAGLNGDLAPAVVDRMGRAIPANPPPPKASWVSSAVSFALAALFAISLFIVAPHAMAVGIGKLLGGINVQTVGFQIIAGLCKLGIFVGYLALLGRVPEIKRLFMYHGAEHKVIATFEADEPLDVAHARRHTTFHARCGTSFLLVVVLLAIVLFSVIFPLLPQLGSGWRTHFITIGLKIPLMLPVAGLAYEFNRWAANHLERPGVRLLVAPGFFMQRLTVSEPTDDMLEVALAALEAALASGRKASACAQANQGLAYQKFADVCARQV